MGNGQFWQGFRARTTVSRALRRMRSIEDFAAPE